MHIWQRWIFSTLMTETVQPNLLEQLAVSKKQVLDFFQTLPETGLGFHGVRDARRSVAGIAEHGLHGDLYSYIIAPHVDPDTSLLQAIDRGDAEMLAGKLLKGVSEAFGVGAEDISHYRPTALVFFDYFELPKVINGHPRDQFPTVITARVPRKEIRQIFVRQTKESRDSFSRRVVQNLLKANQPIFEEIKE